MVVFALAFACPRSAELALLAPALLVRFAALAGRLVAAGVEARLLALGVRSTEPLLTFVLRLLVFLLLAFRLPAFRSPVFTLLPTFTFVRLLSTLMFTFVRRGATTLLFGRYPGTGRT